MKCSSLADSRINDQQWIAYPGVDGTSTFRLSADIDDDDDVGNFGRPRGGIATKLGTASRQGMTKPTCLAMATAHKLIKIHWMNGGFDE